MNSPCVAKTRSLLPQLYGAGLSIQGLFQFHIKGGNCMMAQFVKVAKKSEIPTDTGKLVQVNGKDIALFKIGDKVYALYQVCPHQSGPLDEGGLDGNVLTCPWHGW